MAVRLGNIEPVNFMLGSKQVEELRLGEQLVWKRRLIEGVDYQRYDWLKGDGNAKINTNLIIPNIKNENLLIETNALSLKTGTEQGYIIGNGTISAQPGFSIRATYKGTIEVTQPGAKGYAIAQNRSHNVIVFNQNGIYVNDVLKTTNYLSTPGSSTYPLMIYQWTTADSIYGVVGSIARVVIDGRISLHPCKLLRDIPASLDSQGIARTAGTCGMVEELTGILYTSYGTTGSFSVYND